MLICDYYGRPRSFGGLRYGMQPEPPEPFDCPEEFIEEICENCSNYEECKAEYERILDEDDD